jgi:hypothetical protein
MKKVFSIIFLFAIFLPVLTGAQTVVKVPQDDFGGTGGNLNNAIAKAISDGTLSSTTFELQAAGYYIITGTIEVPAGKKLTITAPDPGTTQQTALPQLLWTSAAGVSNANFIAAYGDLSLKNIWFFYANVLGDQVGSPIKLADDPGKTKKADFEGCLFEYSNVSNEGAAIGVTCASVDITVKNCYFRNNIDAHYRYYGRAVAFPYSTTGWGIKSVLFENCTFANMGYVYMQEAAEYGLDVRFNHCTFLNVVVYALESGWWKTAAVANCLFANTQMFGDIPATRGTGDYYGGTMRIDSVKNFGFVPPFTETDRKIYFGYNSYGILPWLKDWMQNCPYSLNMKKTRQNDQVPGPQPMLSAGTIRFFDTVDVATKKKVFPLMSRENNLDDVDPGFVVEPTNVDSLKLFLNKKWSDNTDCNWAWKIKEIALVGKWPYEENLAYTNATLKTAAMGKFPLGDLYHWYPTQYTTWKTQSATEYTFIQNRLDKGLDIVGIKKDNSIPAEFSLSQNYPNPFNPSTTIKYSVPETGFVSLKIYDMLGQLVATLSNGIHQVGSYTATFDGSDLASGVYVYRLQSESVSISKKFMLIK